MSGGPVPASWMFMRRSRSCCLVAKRLPRLERVLHPLERLPLGHKAQKRHPLEIEQMLFAHGRRVRKVPARHDPGQRAADQGIVVADAAGAPGEMDAKLQRCEYG